LYYWIILALVILLDQSSKWWVSSTFLMGESRPVIDGILWLTYVVGSIFLVWYVFMLERSEKLNG
jgi:lipoprotein signal peptidase